MDDNILDDYFQAYRSATDRAPSRQFRAKILAIADQGRAGEKLNPRRWFDMMFPRTVGWVLTCILGLYFGLPLSDQSGIQAGYYLYDQAQVLIYEDLIPENSR